MCDDPGDDEVNDPTDPTDPTDTTDTTDTPAPADPTDPTAPTDDTVDSPQAPQDWLTDLAPGDETALAMIAATVDGELRVPDAASLAALTSQRRDQHAIGPLRRVFLVAHGSAGTLHIQGDSGGKPISLDRTTFRPLGRLSREALLNADGEIWLVGCHVGCRSPLDPEMDGPLLLLSMARLFGCTVAAPTDFVDARWFDSRGPREDLVPVVRATPDGCPPVAPLPDVATLTSDLEDPSAPTLSAVLGSIAGTLSSHGGAKPAWLGAGLLKVVDGDQPYDGSGALDWPRVSVPVFFADKTTGAVEITLDGLAIGVRTAARRTLYLKREGAPNLLLRGVSQPFGPEIPDKD